MTLRAISIHVSLLCVTLLGCAHTDRVDAPSPTAVEALAPFAWLEGRWVGEIEGGSYEETWSDDMGDSMVGTFRVVTGNRPSFYELMVLQREGSDIMLRLRHFEPTLVALEDVQHPMAYRLTSVTKHEAIFENTGQTASAQRIIYRRSGNRLQITLEGAKGEVEHEFAFTRAK